MNFNLNSIPNEDSNGIDMDNEHFFGTDPGIPLAQFSSEVDDAEPDFEELMRKASLKIAWEESIHHRNFNLKNDETTPNHSSSDGFRPSHSVGNHQQEKLVDEYGISQNCGGSLWWLTPILRMICPKTFRSQRLENLYRRYFIRVDQLSQILALVASCIIFMVIIIVNYIRTSIYTSAILAVVLSIAIIIFIGLIIVLLRIKFDSRADENRIDSQTCIMMAVAYITSATLIFVVCFTSYELSANTVSKNTIPSLAFVYIVYSTIPLPCNMAMLVGLCISVCDVWITAYFCGDKILTTNNVSTVNLFYISLIYLLNYIALSCIIVPTTKLKY